MIAPIAKKLFTVDEYYRIYQAGVLNEDDRVELINGEIVYMSPTGTKHATCVDRLNHILMSQLIDRIQLRVQSSIQLPPNSQPQPDLALLKRKADFYVSAHPTPADIYLLIEVADSSIAFDRNVKIPMYAAAGIPEVWLVDVEAQSIEVYRQPESDSYAEIQIFKPGESIGLQSFPDVQVPVAEVLPIGKEK
jgi:Uma2 family endonuclease